MIAGGNTSASGTGAANANGGSADGGSASADGGPATSGAASVSNTANVAQTNTQSMILSLWKQWNDSSTHSFAPVDNSVHHSNNTESDNGNGNLTGGDAINGNENKNRVDSLL
jgi:hypothetical protein